MTGFAMLLPAEWVLVDLKNARRSGVREIVRGWTAGLSSEQASSTTPVLLARLDKLTSDLAEQGMLALVAQAAGLNEIAVQPMLVVHPLEVPVDVEPLDMLLSVAGSDPSASIIDVDHLIGLATTVVDQVTGDVNRVLATLPADLQARASGQNETLATLSTRQAHRRRYLLGVPDDRTRWVEILGSVEVGDDAEGAALAGAYLEMFDALVKTFEWRR